jgi:hypothetical protein
MGLAAIDWGKNAHSSIKARAAPSLAPNIDCGDLIGNEFKCLVFEVGNTYALTRCMTLRTTRRDCIIKQSRYILREEWKTPFASS